MSVRYRRGKLSRDQLMAVIAEFFETLESGDEKIADDAAANGVDIEALRAAGPDSIAVGKRGAGFGGAGEVILIFLVEKGLELAWERVVKPYIDRRRGDDALGPPAPE